MRRLNIVSNTLYLNMFAKLKLFYQYTQDYCSSVITQTSQRVVSVWRLRPLHLLFLHLQNTNFNKEKLLNTLIICEYFGIPESQFEFENVFLCVTDSSVVMVSDLVSLKYIFFTCNKNIYLEKQFGSK